MTAPTKARIAALQWFHDRGEVTKDQMAGSVTNAMLIKMYDAGQIKMDWDAFASQAVYHLTDAGRQALHEGTRK